MGMGSNPYETILEINAGKVVHKHCSVECSTVCVIPKTHLYAVAHAQHKKASNHHANLPLEMYSFTL